MNDIKALIAAMCDKLGYVTKSKIEFKSELIEIDIPPMPAWIISINVNDKIIYMDQHAFVRKDQVDYTIQDRLNQKCLEYLIMAGITAYKDATNRKEQLLNF